MQFEPDTTRQRYPLLLLGVLLWSAFPAGAGIPGDAETVHYHGPVSAERNRRFFATADNRSARRLVITSAGGDVAAGIALGLWVHAHGLDVEVTDYCLSACANYIFPAGRRKTIRPGAVVAWHGNYTHLVRTGLWRDDIAARRKNRGEDEATATVRARAEAERLARLERDFFARIGVDGYLCWIGKMPPYSAANYYFLSAEDMARFGVTNADVPPGYADTDVSGFDFSIEYIGLE